MQGGECNARLATALSEKAAADSRATYAESLAAAAEGRATAAEARAAASEAQLAAARAGALPTPPAAVPAPVVPVAQEVPAVPVPAVPVPATPLTVPATPLTVPATHDEAGAGEVPLPGATTGTPAGAGLAASALPVTLGQSAGLPAGPTEPNPFVARAGGVPQQAQQQQQGPAPPAHPARQTVEAHMARHHHRLSMLETAMGHERREGEEEPQEDPFAKLP